MFYLLTKYHFPDRVFVTDANGAQFTEALARPQHWVTWIVVNSGSSNNADLIWASLHRHQTWRHYFVLRKRFPAHHSVRRTYGTVEIFEKRSGHAFPATRNRAGAQVRGDRSRVTRGFRQRSRRTGAHARLGEYPRRSRATPPPVAGGRVPPARNPLYILRPRDTLSGIALRAKLPAAWTLL